LRLIYSLPSSTLRAAAIEIMARLFRRPWPDRTGIITTPVISAEQPPVGAANDALASRLQSDVCVGVIADLFCYRDVKLHSALFGWSNPDQTLRVAAGILGKRASGGWTQVRVCCQGCEAFPTMHRTWEPRSGVELELGDMVKTN